jgi:hypothetical protein
MRLALFWLAFWLAGGPLAALSIQWQEREQRF